MPCLAQSSQPRSTARALATPAMLRSSGEPRSIQRYCCFHLLMSRVPSVSLCIFLSLGKGRLEVPPLAMLLHRGPGLGSPGACANHEHTEDLANCLCKVLVMLVFHRSPILLWYLAQLKKPKTHGHQGQELKRRSILKVHL